MSKNACAIYYDMTFFSQIGSFRHPIIEAIATLFITESKTQSKMSFQNYFNLMKLQ